MLSCPSSWPFSFLLESFPVGRPLDVAEIVYAPAALVEEEERPVAVQLPVLQHDVAPQVVGSEATVLE